MCKPWMIGLAKLCGIAAQTATHGDGTRTSFAEKPKFREGMTDLTASLAKNSPHTKDY